MTTIFNNLISVCGSLLMISNAAAQNLNKKDTVYYFVDTLHIPVKDRMFIVGQEGRFYGYRLTCQCMPWQTDAFFLRYAKRKRDTVISTSEFKNIKFITLRKLVNIAVQYGINRIEKTVFYFIEPNGDLLTKNEVYLRRPEQPTNDAVIIK